MDFYLDFSRELEKSHSPEVTLQKMVERIKGVIEQEPARVALAKGTALLSVIHDYQNPQAIQILPTFRDIKESIELLLSALDADIDLEEHLWKERSGGQYNEGPEDQPQEVRRFLDFDGIETWGKARWVAFVAQVDMVTDIAATSPTGVESMAHLLTEIRNSFGRIPVEAQEQALIAADKLALAIREDMERTMDTLQDKHQITLISESMDVGDWYGEDNSVEGFTVEASGADESAAFFTSELQPYLDLSGWGNWGEKDWAIFDQAIAEAQVAATTEPADPEPAMQLFLGVRQNIEALPLHRRFSMGNTADDLMEAVKKGMAQDLFQLQKKYPYAPRSVPIAQDGYQPTPKHNVPPTSNGSDRCWKKGKIGRETVELNFDQIADWGLSQWAALKIEIDKLSAAAELTMDALGQPGQLLEDFRSHIKQVPAHYRGELVQMAARLEQVISGKVSETLSEILKSDG